MHRIDQRQVNRDRQERDRRREALGTLLDVLGRNQMKSACEEVDMWIDLGGFGNDILNARMRAADHQHEAISRVDGQ